MLKATKIAGVLLVLIPILFLGRCVFVETDQRHNLQSLCDKGHLNKQLSMVLVEAKTAGFKVRGQITNREKMDGFDRAYNRIHRQFVDEANQSALTVVFAKPGMGYYACLIAHDDDLIIEAVYEDRSS